MHIPSHAQAKCDLCGEPLDMRMEGVYQRTAGWVKQRSGGGGHAIASPKRENRWAHGHCVERLVYGEQHKLFGAR